MLLPQKIEREIAEGWRIPSMKVTAFGQPQTPLMKLINLSERFLFNIVSIGCKLRVGTKTTFDGAHSLMDGTQEKETFDKR
jgi:hypothetical protein